MDRYGTLSLARHPHHRREVAASSHAFKSTMVLRPRLPVRNLFRFLRLLPNRSGLLNPVLADHCMYEFYPATPITICPTGHSASYLTSPSYAAQQSLPAHRLSWLPSENFSDLGPLRYARPFVVHPYLVCRALIRPISHSAGLTGLCRARRIAVFQDVHPSCGLRRSGVNPLSTNIERGWRVGVG